MKKNALCIGINDYPGMDSDLSGCVNDANDWSELLESKGFAVTQLLDSAAKKQAIVGALRELVTGADSGDVVVLTYSGHGTWVPDREGDEKDGRDEALCPYDLGTVGALTDDEIYDLFDERARGVRIVFLSDSCHSGSVSRGAPQGLVADSAQAAKVRFLPPHKFLTREEMVVADTLARRGPITGKRRHQGVLLSGCEDHEYSYDAWFAGRPNGAFTFAALKALKEDQDADTYRNWHRAIRNYLPSANYPQSPRIQGTSRQRGWRLFE